MSMNLRAVATLDAKPFIASLNELSAATARLQGTVAGAGKAASKNMTTLAAGSRGAVDATEAEIAARQALGKEYQRVNKTSQKTSRASRRSMDEATQGLRIYRRELKDLERREREFNKLGKSHTENFGLGQKAIAARRAQLEFYELRDKGVKGPALDAVDRKFHDALGKYNYAMGRAIAQNIEFPSTLRSVGAALDEVSKSFNKSTDSIKGQHAAYRSMSPQALDKQLKNEELAQARKHHAHVKRTGDAAAERKARQKVIKAQMAVNAITEREKAQELKQLREQERAQREFARANKAAHKDRIVQHASKRYLYSDVGRNLAMGGALSLAAPLGSVFTNAAWEKAYANVIRTADPSFRQDPKAIEALRSSLIGMAKEMPIKFRDITAVATLGNQLGVAADDIYSFTRAADMFSTTTGVSVEDTATAFGRLRTITGDVGTSYMQMSDAIAKVGVNSVATEDEIIKNITQTASISGAIGFTTREMIGLAGAMASVRIPPELARSTLNRTFGRLTKSVNEGGEALNRFSELSGYTQEELKQTWGGPESAKIFQGLLDGIRKAGGDAPEMLKSLGITSVRDVPALMRLANAADAAGQSGQLLRQTMKDAHNSAGETMEQYAIMADTVSGRFQVMLNNIGAFFNALGQNSQGVIKSTIDGLSKLFDWLTDFAGSPAANALGWVSALTGGALLAGSAVAKIGSAVQGLKQYFAARGAAKGMGGLLSGDFKQSRKRQKQYGFDPAYLYAAGYLGADALGNLSGGRDGKKAKGKAPSAAPSGQAMLPIFTSGQEQKMRRGGKNVDEMSKRTRIFSRDTGSAATSWSQLGRYIGTTAPFRAAERAIYGTDKATERLLRRQTAYNNQLQSMERYQPFSGKKIAAGALGATALGLGTAAMTDSGSFGSYVGAGLTGAALGAPFGGPVGMGIGALAGLATNFIGSSVQSKKAKREAWEAQFYTPTTDAMDIAKEITNLRSIDPTSLSRTLQTINVSGKELNLESVKSVKPFKDGLSGLGAALKKDYSKVVLPTAQKEQIGRHADNEDFKFKARYGSVLGSGSFRDSKYKEAFDASKREQAEAGLSTFFNSLEAMRKGGNDEGVMATHRSIIEDQFGGSVEAYLKALKDTDAARNELEALKNQATIQGMELEDYAKEQYAKFDPKNRSKQIDLESGVKGLGTYTQAYETEDEERQRFNAAYISGINQVTGALLGYGEAYNKAAVVSKESGKVIDFNLKTFAKAQQGSIAEARKFQKNMFDLTVADVLSPDQLNELISMGPDGAIIIDKLAEDMRKNGGKLSKESMALVDSIQATLDTRDLDFMGGTKAYADFERKMKDFKGVFKKTNFDDLFKDVSIEDKVSIGGSFQKLEEQSAKSADRIANNLANALDAGNLKAKDTSRVMNAFEQLGAEASKVYSQKLREGTVSVQDIVKASKVDSISIGDLITIDEGNKAKVVESLKSAFTEGAQQGGRSLTEETRKAISNLNLESSLDDVRKAIGDSTFLDNLEGTVTLEALLTDDRYKGDLERLAAYARANGIDIPLDVEPKLESLSKGALQTLVEDKTGGYKAILDIEPDLDKGKILDFFEGTDGVVYTIQIDPDTGNVEKVLNAYETDHEGNTIPVELDLSTAEAKKLLDQYKSDVSQTDLSPALDLSGLQSMADQVKTVKDALNSLGSEPTDIYLNAYHLNEAKTAANELGKSLDALGAEHNINVTAELSKAPAEQSFEEFKSWVANSPLKAVAKDVETVSAMFAWKQFIEEASAAGVLDVDANTDTAKRKVDEVSKQAETKSTKPIDADTQAATNKARTLHNEAKKKAEKLIGANTEGAMQKSRRLQQEASKKASKALQLLTGSARSELSSFNRAASAPVTKNVLVKISESVTRIFSGTKNSSGGGGKAMAHADGGVVEYYARGGVRENHVAQIAKAGTWRVWAEDETGGEAYIPLAKSKRKRSEAILAEVADRFGYVLQGKEREVVQYADGGHYQAQEFKRTQRAAMTPSRVSDQPRVSISEVNFSNPSQKDQFREFSREVNRIARGL